jgi:serine protease AprX
MSTMSTESGVPQEPEARRWKVRFRDVESMQASEAVESSPLVSVPVRNERRQFLSVTAAEDVVGVIPLDEAPERQLEDQLVTFAKEYDAEIVEDVRYDLEESGDLFDLPVEAEQPDTQSLDDVLDLIKARDAWETSRGEGVAIAIVDTGINGARPEFPPSKRVSEWAPAGVDPWIDGVGHGTMCACIATGTTAQGGVFDGVAPDAGLISCRTKFFDSEIVTIYDFLTDFANDHEEMAVVASNSFGRKTGTAPPPPPDSDLADALTDALEAGVVVCFSAGNYHELAGGAAAACSPTSIWLHKCLGDVLTVATSRPDGTMWFYSSRGPGQFQGRPDMKDKPDVTAPTPPNGRVVYGDDVRSLPDGWGTSGACPQVAGLAALLRGKRAATVQEVRDAIRDTAVSLGHAPDCQGEGLIDCAAAIAAL